MVLGGLAIRQVPTFNDLLVACVNLGFLSGLSTSISTLFSIAKTYFLCKFPQEFCISRFPSLTHRYEHSSSTNF